ncbi:MAG: hypothetical protein ABIS45_17535 [Burkholderiales bacterium]
MLKLGTPRLDHTLPLEQRVYAARLQQIEESWQQLFRMTSSASKVEKSAESSVDIVISVLRALIERSASAGPPLDIHIGVVAVVGGDLQKGVFHCYAAGQAARHFIAYRCADTFRAQRGGSG